MREMNKIFINKEPSDTHLEYIKELCEDLDIKERLVDSFIYVNILKEDEVEILAFKDNHVFIASKELNVNNKMAIEYIIRREEISQKFNEMCYWENINDIKKFAIVVRESLTLKKRKKEYAKKSIYSKSYVSAVVQLLNEGFEDYLYLENVDDEI